MLSDITIGVMISVHEARITNGMLNRALNSVWAQTRKPDAVAIAVDSHRQGAAVTKNRALQMLNTEFCAVLDSDDWFLPNHLEVLERAQLETNADLVYSWFETDPPGRDPFPSWFFTEPWNPESPRHTTTTIMARSSMMRRVGYHATSVPDHPYSEDDWLMTCGLINLGATVHHVPEKTWVYSHHSGNSSGLAGKGDASR